METFNILRSHRRRVSKSGVKAVQIFHTTLYRANCIINRIQLQILTSTIQREEFAVHLSRASVQTSKLRSSDPTTKFRERYSQRGTGGSLDSPEYPPFFRLPRVFRFLSAGEQSAFRATRPSCRPNVCPASARVRLIHLARAVSAFATRVEGRSPFPVEIHPERLYTAVISRRT